MYKIIAFMFSLVAQFILVRHDLILFDPEWWTLMACLITSDFFWRFDKDV